MGEKFTYWIQMVFWYLLNSRMGIGNRKKKYNKIKLILDQGKMSILTWIKDFLRAIEWLLK
jgi:hypothetical protein